MMDKLYMLTIIILASIVNGCFSSPSKNDRHMYEWLPTSCAPTEFPIGIIEAKFISSDNQVIDIPKKNYLAFGWGKTGAINLVGADEKPIPKELSIRWFSFRDRKFYECNANLPVKEIEKLFQEGFISPITEKHETYKYIIVGTAPLGTVSIWLSGNGVTKEVFFASGKQLQVNTDEFIGASPDIESYARSILKGSFTDAEILKSDYPDSILKKWSTVYRMLYDWQLKVITSVRNVSIVTFFYNGEIEYSKNLAENRYINSRPIPKQLSISWETRETEKGYNEIIFDENEIFTAFNKLAIGGKENITLQVEINNVNNIIEVYVMNNKNMVKLEKCIVKP